MTNTRRKNKNASFILSVCLMVALIAALMIPTTIAWFTDSTSAPSGTTINFGRVNVELGENVTVTSSRDINYVLPGDTLTLSLDFYNAGTVSIYTTPYTEITFMHGTTDISQEIKPYVELTHTIQVADLVADTEQTVLLLTSNNSQSPANMKIGVKLKGELPNYITKSGTQYWLNGNTADVKIVLKTTVSAIQKDNNTMTGQDLEKQLLKLINPNAYQTTYTYSTNAGGETTLYADGKQVVLTAAPVDISAAGDGSIMAFPTTNTSGETKLILAGSGTLTTITSEQFTQLGGENIKELEIGGNVSAIAEYALESLPHAVKTITIGESVVSLGSNLTGDTELGLSTINFYSNGKLTTIGSTVFYGSGIDSVVIPKTVTSLGYQIFGHAIGTPPRYISVEEGNPVYHSVDNCIIETATNTLVWGTELSIIPNYVETIRSYAFYYYGWDSYLFEIPDSVTKIGQYALCWGMVPTYLIVGTGITTVSEIANGVFDNSLASGLNEYSIYTKHTSNTTFTVDMTEYGEYPINVYYYSETALTQEQLNSDLGYWGYGSNGLPEIWKEPGEPNEPSLPDGSFYLYVNTYDDHFWNYFYDSYIYFTETNTTIGGYEEYPYGEEVEIPDGNYIGFYVKTIFVDSETFEETTYITNFISFAELTGNAAYVSFVNGEYKLSATKTW